MARDDDRQPPGAGLRASSGFHHRTPGERTAAQAAALQAARDIADLQAIAGLDRAIRGLMAVLRSCTTPQSRAVAEARIRPLVLRRRQIQGRRR